MIKIVIATVLLVFIAGCGKKSEDSKNTIDQNFSEHKSAHESDWEKYSDRTTDNAVNGNYQIFIEENINITDKNIGSFKNPKFTNDGKKIIFTNENYSQIWLYDLSEKKMNKIVEMPQCGFRFQIAENNDEIYFRNKEILKDRKKQGYSIYKYSISKDNIELVYNSEYRISQLFLEGSSIYFLENKEPTNLNLLNKNLSAKFDFPYFFVQNDLLVRVSETLDTIKYSGKDYRFISCKYSKDKEAVFVLTANNGILILNLSGEIINQYKNASSISKLYQSNLVVFTEEKDDGMKILSSNLKFGFLNSNNKVRLSTDFNKQTFNPDWSPIDNKLAYSSDNGIINILSFKIEKQTQ